MKDILNSYTLAELKKEVSKSNMKNYSKLLKTPLIEYMTTPENINKFKHIKMKDKAAPKPKPAPKSAPKPKPSPIIYEKINTLIQYFKSPSTRQYNYLEKLGFNMGTIDRVQQNIKLTDFYPTPEKCILEGKDYIKESKNFIDPTAGIGAPIYYISILKPNATYTAIEYSEQTFNLANDILKGSNINLKKGNFFNLVNTQPFDYYFLNPPFTSSVSSKDNYYIKFILKLGMIHEISNLKYVVSQLLFPVKFIEQAGYKIGDTNTSIIADMLMKVPKTEIERYLKELNFFEKLNIDIKEMIKEYKNELQKGEKYNIMDVYYMIFEDIFYGQCEWRSICNFDFTKFKIANLFWVLKRN